MQKQSRIPGMGPSQLIGPAAENAERYRITHNSFPDALSTAGGVYG